MVQAQNLYKKFSRTEKKKKTEFFAVNGVSLSVEDGETLGILGPNGAGKTTLLRMLGTLMEPTTGTVTHILRDGTVLSEPRLIKKHMGYLSDNTKLYKRFTVRELLQSLAGIYELPPLDVIERVELVIQKLDMNQFADVRIEKLSTGQTQRASIARCLLHDPDTYIFDEPTLGLDIMSSAAIVDFMRSEKERGKTIIYSTHYMEEAESLCDRIILLNHGSIAAQGAPNELCSITGCRTLRDSFLSIIRKGGAENEL